MRGPCAAAAARRGEQGSGAAVRRCHLPGQAGPSPGRAALLSGTAAPPRFPSFFSLTLGCGGATSGSPQTPSSPPPAQVRLARLSLTLRRTPTPRISRLPSPSLPHAGLAAPPQPRGTCCCCSRRAALTCAAAGAPCGGRGSVRRGSAGAAAAVPLLPRRLSELRFCRHREGAAPPDPAATRAPVAVPWAALSPRAPALPSRVLLSAEAGPGLLGIPRPVPLAVPGLLSRRPPAAAVPQGPIPQPSPEARSPLPGRLSRRSELRFCSSEEGGCALGKGWTASLSLELS